RYRRNSEQNRASHQLLHVRLPVVFGKDGHRSRTATDTKSAANLTARRSLAMCRSSPFAANRRIANAALQELLGVRQRCRRLQVLGLVLVRKALDRADDLAVAGDDRAVLRVQ